MAGRGPASKSRFEYERPRPCCIFQYEGWWAKVGAVGMRPIDAVIAWVRAGPQRPNLKILWGSVVAYAVLFVLSLNVSRSVAIVPIGLMMASCLMGLRAGGLKLRVWGFSSMAAYLTMALIDTVVLRTGGSHAGYGVLLAVPVALALLVSRVAYAGAVTWFWCLRDRAS